jgi:ATP-dependent Zn protease
MTFLCGKMQENENNESRHMLFTHVHFDVMYNGDRVVEISVRTDPNKAVDISEEKDTQVKFSFSAQWSPTTKTYEKRMEKYQKYSFLPQHLEIHWFSIINSCVTVLLLTGFLTTILMRVLKNDFIK